jgi:hypothetical protein
LIGLSRWAFSVMKRWSLGTYHGLRRNHLDAYLNEFILNEFMFRDNHRFHRQVSLKPRLGSPRMTSRELLGY